MHAIIWILELTNFMLFFNKVHKVQAKNKVQKVRTSQLCLGLLRYSKTTGCRVHMHVNDVTC